jgi:hypothetical protein
MPSSGTWRRVDLVWIDVSKEHIASIFGVPSSEPSVPTRSTRCHIPEDGILHEFSIVLNIHCMHYERDEMTRISAQETQPLSMVIAKSYTQ